MIPEDEALVSRVPSDRRDSNGIPDSETATARERAAIIAADALSDLLVPGGVRTSPLGPAWSRDLDLHVTARPSPERLARLGWRSLDALLGRIGAAGVDRWAIVEEGAVLAGADFHLGAPPDPVQSVLARCGRRGEVRVREVLELRALARMAQPLPGRHPALALAARVEAGLGGNTLARWADGPPVGAPATLPRRLSAIARSWASVIRSPFRPRFGVALSGVDGSGKSSLASELARDLDRAGVPAAVVWTRPGMRLRRLDRLALAGKRVLRQPASPGVERIAGGEGSEALASRRGVLGWVWALLVAVAFVRDVRRRVPRAEGVVVFDRHLLDALVTLEVFYRGVSLRLHRALVRGLLPRALVTVYLDVPAAVALARKPGDAFGELVVRRQLDRYEARRPEVAGLVSLDATLPHRDLAAEIFRLVTGPDPSWRRDAVIR